jgi:predicted RNA binding protein YcfA (HicA-like mRNA interferase family)
MKRKRLIKHLTTYNCYLLREGRSHSIFKNVDNGNISPIPRHNEVAHYLVKSICKDFDIPFPDNFQ